MEMEKQTFVSDLHLACSKEEKRPALQCVHFINGYAYATDTKILIKQSLEYSSNILNYELLECKAVHADNFKEIRKYHIVEVTEEGFNCTAKNGRKAFYPFMEFDEDVKVPNFDDAIPREMEELCRTGLSPRYIGILDKAMAGGSHVKATFNGAEGTIRFHSIDSNYANQVAMLTPSTLDN
jgi:hypothetical protein